MSKQRDGVVSVVLVNFRGTDDTLHAISELQRLEWPADKLEIVVVENASGDDSYERLKTVEDQITLIKSQENLGFAGGCNLGVERATGEYVAFLNNDARPDPRWIAEAVAAFEASPQVGAVASKVLDWEGENVDFVDAGLTWYGMGYKPYTAQKYRGDHEHGRDVLFGTGSAMFVRASVYQQLGGFDENYFMFFEDVDLGWRLNLLGWRYYYEPKSIAFHKHHASMASFGSFKESYLLERNALYTIYKNLEQGSLDHTLPASMAMSIRRGIAKGGLDSTGLDLRKPGGDAEPEMSVSKETMASVFAIDQFVENLPKLEKPRIEVQSTRVVADRRIRRLFGDTDIAAYQNKYYLEGYKKLVHAFNVIDEEPQLKVVVVTGDPIGVKMAGPAIRAWNIAQALSAESDVRLVSLSNVEAVNAPFEVTAVRPHDEKAFKVHEKWADVIIFQGHAMTLFKTLRETSKIVVADVYDPMHFEQLEQARELPRAQWDAAVADASGILNEQLARGDFFLCASDRQKHLYLGQLAALGRINPANYENDPDLSSLMAVVPFGLDAKDPVHERDVLKGVREGFGKQDKVLIWGGGLYNWFDPETLISAVAGLSERRDNVRLFFQGVKHPHPGVPEMEIVARSRALAEQLGAAGTSVFFNDSWIDYADRQNYLLEADAGVSTHHAHIETTFSFRTRILDYLWAGLPMVVTEGDSFADLVEKEGLGIVVPDRDVAALEAALEKVLFDEDFIKEARANVARVREQFRWERVLEPITEFAKNPVHARDLQRKRGKVIAAQFARRRARRNYGFMRDVKRTLHYLQQGGPLVVLEKVWRRVKR